MRSSRQLSRIRLRTRVLCPTLGVAAGALLLSSCAMLDYPYLQDKVLEQEQTITELANKGKKWEEAFYQLRDQSLKNYEDYKRLIGERDQEIQRLRSARSDRERKAAESLHQAQIELQAALDKNEELRVKLGSLSESSQKQVGSLNKQLKGANAELERAKKDLALARSEAKTLRTQSQTAASRYETTRKQLEAAQSEAAKLKTTLKARDGKIAEQEKTIASLRNKAESATADSDEVAQLRADLKTKNSEIARLKNQLAGKGSSGRKTPAELLKAKEELEDVLKPQIDQKDAVVLAERGVVVVRLQSDLLFAPATVQLQESAKSVLRNIAAVIVEYPDYQLRIEGHTDPQPVRNMPFPDNLALSSQRADNVLRYFLQIAQLPTASMQVRSTGCSYWNPIAKNDTPEGRRQNRRVEIILASKD